LQPLSRHIPELDGVRGIAILLVLAHHLLPATAESLHLKALQGFFESGWIGVDLFFVLSGFLITGILFEGLNGDHYFRNFYARRFLRIFPLYYAVLLLFIVFTRPLQIEWHGRQFGYLLYLQNTGLFKLLPGTVVFPVAGIGHFWSLAVEEQFYMVWPLVVFGLRKPNRIMFFTVFVAFSVLLVRTILVLFHVSSWGLYSYTPFRADALLLGGCLAMLLRSSSRATLSAYAPAMLFISSAPLFAIAYRTGYLDYVNSGLVESVGFTLLAFASVALITLSVDGPHWLRAVMKSLFLRFFGKYSYGIYVIHFPVLGITTYLIGKHMPGVWGARAVLIPATCFLCTIALAYLSYNFFEEPILKLKRYFPSGEKDAKTSTRQAAAAES
jgi:peptidoglycan/LPS O-acetylase OafA/YrhL